MSELEQLREDVDELKQALELLVSSREVAEDEDLDPVSARYRRFRERARAVRERRREERHEG